MRKLMTTMLVAALTWAVASAVPAKPGVTRTVTQPDGTTMTLRLVGDEYHHALLTDDGLMVAENDKGVFCYRTADGVSDVMAHPKALRTAAEMAFLTVNQQKTDWRTNAGQAAKRARAKRAPKKVGECPHSGSIKVPVLLVQFSDVSFANSYSTINAAYTSTTGKSAYRYYYENSDHNFVPQFDVYGPVTLSNTQAYYGGNDSSGNDLRPEYMVNEACSLLNNNVDFSQYDNNGDGVCDVVIVVYAGGGEAQTGEENQIWPHQWTLSSAGIAVRNRTYDNTKIDAYAVFNELNGDSTSQLDGIGTFCHEFGHCLGLPDFYDIVYGNHFGMGDWSLMCGGSYNDDSNTPAGLTGHERDFLGWRALETPTPGTNITLQALQNGGKAYKVVNDKHPNEYYVLENRQNTNWDQYLPSKGLMVTHVDYNQTFWESNYVNCTTDPYSTGSTNRHQRMTIIPADGTTKMQAYQGQYYTVTSDEKGDLYPYNGNNELTDSSTPAAKVYNNSSTDSNASSANYYMGKPITEITQNSDGTVSLWYMRGSTTPLDAPSLNAAANVTSSGWTASWNAVSNAATYELQIDPAGGGSSSSSDYVKVTSTSDLTSGQYLIVYEEGSVAFDGGLSTLDATNNTISVTINNNKIAADATTNAAAFTFDATAGTLKSASGMYIGNASNSNGLTASATALTNTVTISDGSASVKSGGGAYLRYNSNSDQARFRFFKSSSYTNQKAIQLYKLGGSGTAAPRRTGATSRTITGITGTSYNVTGMADDTNFTFKVRAVPATSDTDYSSSDWSNAQTVHTIAADPEPLILADETASFMAFVNQSATEDITILYEDLSSNITAAISGTNAAMFSCDNSITIDSTGDGEATLTVTYSPTAVGSHTATLTLSSTGADPVTVALNGTATEAPLPTYNPVLDDASNITTSGFTASWTDQTDAAAVQSYTLQISKKAQTATTTVNDVLNNANTIGETVTTYSSWTVTGTSGAVYAGQSAGSNGTIQLRSNYSNSGIVSTTSGGKIRKVTVTWNASSSGKTLDVYGYNTAFLAPTDLYNTSATKLGSLPYGTTELEISGDYAYVGVRSNSGALYLDDITFSWEQTSTSGSIQRRRAVTDTGDADSGTRTISGITDKTYAVTGLTPGLTYEFKVKAVYTDRAEADESEWSNIKEVTISDGPHTPTLAADDLEFDGDYYVGGTYTKTLEILAEYLTDDVTLAISGDDAAMFSVPETIPASEFTNGAYNLTVTYSPTTADVHSATLTISSTGAEPVVVELTGIADYQLFTPVMTAAQSVSSNSFKAVWTDENDASRVASYTLYVNKKEETPTLIGDYSFANGLNSQWTKSSGYGATDNDTHSYRLGSGSQGCVLVGPTINITSYTKVTVVINAKYYGNDNSTFKVSFVGNERTISPTSSFADYVEVFEFYPVTSQQAAVTISVSPGKRIYLANVSIYAGDVSGALSAPRHEVATDGDADDGGLTVTGITDKEYTVDGLTPGETYEFKVKAVYTDESESEWSNTEEVTLLDQEHTPDLDADDGPVFNDIYVGSSDIQYLWVYGIYLTDVVTVTISGDDAQMFSAPATIDPSSFVDALYNLPVTYAPTTAGVHNATLTLSYPGVQDVVVSLTGSAILPLEAPVMATAQNVTSSSFKAVWTDNNDASRVTSYTLYVNKKGGDEPMPTLIPLLTETFNGSKVDNDASQDISSSLDDVTDNAGWTGTKVYKAGGGGLKLGSSSVAGCLKSPGLNLSASNGKVTVKVNARAYSDSESTLQMYVTDGENDGSAVTVNNTLSSDNADYIVVLDCTAADGQSVAFVANKRCYILSVTVYAGDVSAQLASSAAPRRVASESGDADNGGLTVTGITDKFYTVTGLTPGATYEFKVKAIEANVGESEWSNTEEVTTGNTLAEVLDSPSGDYTVSDNLVIAAVAPQGGMVYATNGTDWMPIKVETNDNFAVGDVITLVQGSFNGSTTAPLFTMTECAESTETVDYVFETFFLGQNDQGQTAVWERMPVAGEVAYFYGYFFTENGVPTLRGYSGKNGEKGRSLILQGDNYGDISLTEGGLYRVLVCVNLAEAWSGAPRRVSPTDDNAFQNLRGELIDTEDLTQTGIDMVDGREVSNVRYINLAGQASDRPHDGVNIVVTTFTDGSTTVVKVLK